jgi:hypothetical protein
MDSKQKMAIAGSGLVLAGMALGIVGVALITPAVIAWTSRLVEKGAEGLAAKVEGASKTVGSVAGTLHRSFNEAKRAGVAEFRRDRSVERNAS